MIPFAFHERAKRSPDLGSECLGKRRAGDEVRSTFEEKPTYGRVPSEQDVRERNRGHFCAVVHEKFDEFEISFGNSVHQRIVFRFLATIVSREQFDETVESAVERDLERCGLAFRRNGE